MEPIMGYLFKKDNVTFEGENYEIFEYKDFVFGIKFVNTSGEHLVDIVSGEYVNSLAMSFENDSNEKYQYIVIERDYRKKIKENNNKVDFYQIRENELNNNAKYYFKTETGFDVIKDKSFLDFLENRNKSHSSFEEEVFEKETDISSMYLKVKETIVSQDEQIMKILTSIFKNDKVVNSNFDIDLIAKLKENILIYGPTGTGKTEILKRVSKLIKTPIVIEDATSLSETGYVGRNITDMLQNLYLAADNNLEVAERGILVIDEFDKLAEKGNTENHVSRIGVQRSLLKLLDGSLFYFDNKKFNTSKLTIVGLGAFEGISNNDNYSHLTNSDFINYGIMRELMGRFSKMIAMNPLLKEDIEKILINSNFSPLNTYKKLFDEMGIEFSYTDEFVNFLAEKAVSLNSGARSLKTVFDDYISGAMFKIFAGDYKGINLIKPKAEEEPYILVRK